MLNNDPAPIASFDDERKSGKSTEKLNFCSSKEIFRILNQFFFSQIGLFLIVLIYIVVGGFIFSIVESRYEFRQQEKIQRKYSIGIEKIRRIVDDEFNWILNNSFELRYALWRGISSRLDEKIDSNWKIEVDSRRFSKLIEKEIAKMRAEQEKLVDKHDFSFDALFEPRWTFSTALLFSATVITTVGYGNITPKSMLGKLMTCLYATFGIPIMIMYINNTGDLLAFIFVKHYSQAENILYRRKNRLSRRIFQTETGIIHHVPIGLVVGILLVYILAGAVLFSLWEGWSYVDGAYFSFITFSTIGLGDLVPGKGTLTENKNGKTILCVLYLLFGLVLTAMCFKLIQDDLFAVKQRIYQWLCINKSEQTSEC